MVRHQGKYEYYINYTIITKDEGWSDSKTFRSDLEDELEVENEFVQCTMVNNWYITHIFVLSIKRRNKS